MGCFKTRLLLKSDYVININSFLVQYKEVPLFNLSNEQVGTIKLKRDIFEVPIRTDIIHRVVVWQLAKRRKGVAKAKNRAEVRGGGRKPRPQKKTGRARVGSIRSPLFRGGGVTFPPRPRFDFIFSRTKLLNE